MVAPLTKKAVGLWTAPNRYDVPEGALVQAMNVLIRRDGVISPRWGKAQQTRNTRYSSGGATVDYWHRMGTYRDALYFAGYEYGSSSKYYIAASQGDFGNVAPVVLDTGVIPPDGIAAYLSNSAGTFFDVEFLAAGRNLYYSTFYGLKRFDDTATGTSRRAGNVPCALSCFPRPVQLASTKLVRLSNVTTATWPYAHGFVVGVSVDLTVSGDANFPVFSGKVITTVPSATTFTYADVAANATSAAACTLGAAQFVDSNGFLTTNEQVAYRGCLVEYDTNGTEHVGEMSARSEVINAAPYIGAAANKNVQLAILFPANTLTRKTKFQAFRSKKIAGPPLDELYQVYERYLTDVERAQGYAWFKDISDNDVMGTSSYSNETLQGTNGNNLPPPACKTMTLWKDRMVVCNTAGRSAVEMQLLSTDSASGGLAAADTFAIIDDAVSTGNYIARDTNASTFLAFLRSSGGTPSQDVKQTVLSLCDTINWGYAASTVTPLVTWRAGFLSAANDFPGRFFIQRILPDFNEPGSNTANARFIASSGTTSGRAAFAPQPAGYAITSGSAVRAANVTTVTVGTSAQFVVGEFVTLYASAAALFTGTPLAIAGTDISGKILSIGATITIDNAGADGNVSAAGGLAITPGPTFNPDRNSNRVCVSKVRNFEAFPAFNYVPCGTDANVIQKAAPCGDSCLLFTNEGLFRMRDSGESFTVEMIDPTARIWARDSVQPYKEKVMAWLLGGVAVCDESGVEYVSKPVEDQLRNGTSSFSLWEYELSQRSFGVVNPEDELYELRLSFNPVAPTGTIPRYSTINLTYNLFNQTWTEDNIPAVCEAVYNGQRFLIQYLAGASTTPLYVQRPGIWYGGDAIPDISVALNYVGGIITDLGSNRYSAALPTAAVTSNGSPVTTGVTIGDLYLGGTTGGLYLVTAASYDAGSPGFEWSITLESLYGSAYSLLNDTTLTGIVTPSTCIVEWAPVTMVEENKLKLFQEIAILFGVAELYKTQISFYTELIPTTETVNAGDFADQFSTATGMVETYEPANLRLLVPQQHRRAQQLSIILTIASAGAWTVLGLSVKADKQDSTRISRT